ncbi:MAG: ankyrin repeat domain-containing protein, partial [Gammaproteobacteria bacterium]|nr:ankyrin repeat domain-containing protein [Gammaproteobacteria bacterium]
MRQAFFAALCWLVFTGSAQAQAISCGAWNTRGFMQNAAVADIERCLAAGADINARNEDRETPLHHAAEVGNTETINALIEAGANLNARAWMGESPLHHAAESGNAETINALLAAG